MKYNLINVIDFEMLQSDKPEIVQVGITVVDMETMMIVKKTGFYIKPERMEHYTADFFQLTGIKKRLIEKGFPLHRGIEILNNKHGLKNRPFVSFGKDWKQLIDECHDKNIEIEINNVFDLSLFWMIFHKEEANISLANLLQKNNIDFEGRQHNAEDDAYNTAKLLLKIITD